MTDLAKDLFDAATAMNRALSAQCTVCGDTGEFYDKAKQAGKAPITKEQECISCKKDSPGFYVIICTDCYNQLQSKGEQK